jgi:hypothetical protein
MSLAPREPGRGPFADKGRQLFCCVGSGVGLDVLHNNDDRPVWALCDRVPDGQVVRWEMETVRTR